MRRSKMITFLFIVLALVIGLGSIAAFSRLQPLVVSTDHWVIAESLTYRGLKVDVELSDEIMSPYYYFNLKKALSTLTKYDTLNIHLHGHGGRVDGLVYLAGMIESSNAFVTMYVDDNVFSAHADLAALGDKSVVKPGVQLGYHDIQVIDDKGFDWRDQPVLAAGVHESVVLGQQELFPLITPMLTNDELGYITANHHNMLYLNKEQAEARFYVKNLTRPRVYVH